MPLDQLLQALEREVNATVERLLADARADADRLASSADASLSERREQSVEARVRSLQRGLDEALGAATRQARNRVLLAREALVERVMVALRAALPAAVVRTDYQDQLPLRVGAALACVGPDEPVVVRCPSALASVLEDALGGRPDARVQADDTAGSGFLLTALHGGLEVDDTLEGRVVRQHVSLAREALKLLEAPS